LRPAQRRDAGKATAFRALGAPLLPAGARTPPHLAITGSSYKGGILRHGRNTCARQRATPVARTPRTRFIRQGWLESHDLRRRTEGHPLQGFLRAPVPPREHRVFFRTKPRSLAETRRRGGMKGYRLQWLSVSPCLRESNGFSRPKPGSLAKPRRREETPFESPSLRLRGFARAGVSFRGTAPIFSRGHGGTGKAMNSRHRSFSAPPRDHRVFGFRRLRREDHESLANPPKTKGPAVRGPFLLGWGTRIRTWVDGVRVRSPTARRSPKELQVQGTRYKGKGATL
jgi:hypothetical protein